MFYLPTPTVIREPVVTWSGLFNDEQIEKLFDLVELQEFKQAQTGFGNRVSQDTKVRNSEVSFLEPDEQSHWVYESIAHLISRVNYDKFGLELSHIETLQITKYGVDQHYHWHMDTVNNGSVTDRKLSMSMLLSDPEKDFDGGEFCIVRNGDIEKPSIVNLKKGDCVFFQSFFPHTVKPVTRGERISLVAWCVGSYV